jgi:S-adenosylmethionine:tRNA ribosyltransferase-isomerase
MMAAALGERWRDVYDHAIANGYRFLSFGDAMYIEITR